MKFPLKSVRPPYSTYFNIPLKSFYLFILQMLTTPVGISIKWDGKNNAQIEMPQLYFNKTCGLCGTYDGNPDNDYKTPEGMQVHVLSL